MRITAVRLFRLTGTMETQGPFWEERLVRPIDIYPEYRSRDDFEGGEQIDAHALPRWRQHFVQHRNRRGAAPASPARCRTWWRCFVANGCGRC